ncbi:MAG TPA: TonB-dependent receptor plug domain-containing protein, partial [Vicinamibacterales bacterium]|nr:TonB-dependent receptor plug domain-containing protein [Vicinamibacterales bacterium]
MKNKSLVKADRNRRRRRRGTARLFVFSAAFLASASGAIAHPVAARGSGEATAARVRHSDDNVTAARAAEQGRTQYNIPAGPLADVVAAFERASGVKVMLALDSLGSIQSPGVKGSFTTSEALEQLLVGTSLTARLNASGEAFIDLEARSESVEVVGNLPGVQSPKYQAPLRDIAQTIAVIPQAVMEEQGATTLSEVLRNVPGITLQAGEGGGSS